MTSNFFPFFLIYLYSEPALSACRFVGYIILDLKLKIRYVFSPDEK